MNNNNPLNLPQLQGLLDIKGRLGGNLTIDDAIELLQEDADTDGCISSELQQDWDKHRYPDKRLKFAPITLYDLAPEIHTVSAEAQSLLLLMIRLQAQKTGYVAIKKGFFIDVLHLGDKKARQFNRYIQELTDIYAIRPVHIPPRGSRAPAIYQINSGLSRIGDFQPKDKLARCAEKIIPPLKKSQYSRTTEIITIRTETGDIQVICGTLEAIIDKDKKIESIATNNEPDNVTKENEDIPFLCPEPNCTNNKLKNQDTDITEDSLTQMTIYDILNQYN